MAAPLAPPTLPLNPEEPTMSPESCSCAARSDPAMVNDAVVREVTPKPRIETVASNATAIYGNTVAVIPSVIAPVTASTAAIWRLGFPGSGTVISYPDSVAPVAPPSAPQDPQARPDTPPPSGSTIARTTPTRASPVFPTGSPVQP